GTGREEGCAGLARGDCPAPRTGTGPGPWLRHLFPGSGRAAADTESRGLLAGDHQLLEPAAAGAPGRRPVLQSPLVLALPLGRGHNSGPGHGWPGAGLLGPRLAVSCAERRLRTLRAGA